MHIASHVNLNINNFLSSGLAERAQQRQLAQTHNLWLGCDKPLPLPSVALELQDGGEPNVLAQLSLPTWRATILLWLEWLLRDPALHCMRHQLVRHEAGHPLTAEDLRVLERDLTQAQQEVLALQDRDAIAHLDGVEPQLATHY